MEELDELFADLLIDTKAEGVFTLDGKGRVTLWNKSMEPITGYTAKDLFGRTCGVLNFNLCLQKRMPKESAGLRYLGAWQSECQRMHTAPKRGP